LLEETFVGGRSGGHVAASACENIWSSTAWMLRAVVGTKQSPKLSMNCMTQKALKKFHYNKIHVTYSMQRNNSVNNSIKEVNAANDSIKQ
jgi:hypothetical protein